MGAKLNPPVIIAPWYLDLISYLNGFHVTAQALGPAIIARHALTPRATLHEVIHVRQWLEISIVVASAAVLFAMLAGSPTLLWVALWMVLPGIGAHAMLHGLFWILLRLRGHSSKVAYQLIPFELEAYRGSQNELYLAWRRSFAWMEHVWRRR